MPLSAKKNAQKLCGFSIQSSNKVIFLAKFERDFVVNNYMQQGSHLLTSILESQLASDILAYLAIKTSEAIMNWYNRSNLEFA